jgi:hypothetical protein
VIIGVVGAAARSLAMIVGLVTNQVAEGFSDATTALCDADRGEVVGRVTALNVRH